MMKSRAISLPVVQRIFAFGSKLFFFYCCANKAHVHFFFILRAVESKTVGKIRRRVSYLAYNRVFKFIITVSSKMLLLWNAITGEFHSNFQPADCDIKHLAFTNKQRELLCSTVEDDLLRLRIQHKSVVSTAKIPDECIGIIPITNYKGVPLIKPKNAFLVPSVMGSVVIINCDTGETVLSWKR